MIGSPFASCACTVAVWGVPAQASGASNVTAKNWAVTIETFPWHVNAAAGSVARMVWSPGVGSTAVKSCEP